MNKRRFLLLLIIILAIVLRIFYLGKIPVGFYSDEASYGYNAYSVLKTGSDEYGNFLPLAFKSFGDWKTPLYIYFNVPFVWILGLSEVSLRLSSALLGIGAVILIYHLAKTLFKNISIALISSFFAAISPFNLQFNRMAHENNLVVFLILLGILFFVKSLKSSNYIFLSALVFVLSIYTYHDARIFTPLFVLALGLIYRREISAFKKKLSLAIILSVLLLLPFVSLFQSDAFWSRPKFTIISSDPGITPKINEERGEDMSGSYLWPNLFHNKIISYTQYFLGNYMKHYSFEFLFVSGDPVKIYQTSGMGILYLISAPFLILGIYYLFRNKFPHKWLILAWLILPPIPSALTRFVPSASRILSLSPVTSILSALGIVATLTFFKQLRFKRIYQIFLAFLIIINVAYYLHYYYVNTQVRFAKEWHYGMKDVFKKISKVQNSYSQVWLSKNAWGYIYPLFYLAYPPEKYQPQAKLSTLNEFGFGWISSFDKYVFSDIPDKSSWSSSILYVGSAEDFPGIKKPLYTVYYPDGQVAFYLADKNSF